MSITILLTVGWLIVASIMLVLYIIQRKTLDASPVDVAWAANLGLLAVLYACFLEGYGPRQYLIMGLTGFWSFRLAAYLLFDRVIGKDEDGRYRSIRETWPGNIQKFFFWFFQAQALLDIVLSLSFLVAVTNPKPYLDHWDIMATILCIISIAGETMADLQLARFRSNPANRGRTCRFGLWRYSRHPNYFFEWLHWCVYPFLAIGSSFWWLTLIAPALMLYFIFRITGIPATESQAVLSRGDDYRNYQATTNVFVPWFPKKEIS